MNVKVSGEAGIDKSKRLDRGRAKITSSVEKGLLEGGQ